MDIDYHFIEDVLVVNVTEGQGRLTNADINDFIYQVRRLSQASANVIAFNMSKKSFLNSSGLGELIKLKDSLVDSNKELVLVCPSPRVKMLISVVGVDQFFSIVNSEDELG